MSEWNWDWLGLNLISRGNEDERLGDTEGGGAGEMSGLDSRDTIHQLGNMGLGGGVHSRSTAQDIIALINIACGKT